MTSDTRQQEIRQPVFVLEPVRADVQPFEGGRRLHKLCQQMNHSFPTVVNGPYLVEEHVVATGALLRTPLGDRHRTPNAPQMVLTQIQVFDLYNGSRSEAGEQLFHATQVRSTDHGVAMDAQPSNRVHRQIQVNQRTSTPQTSSQQCTFLRINATVAQRQKLYVFYRCQDLLETLLLKITSHK